MQARSLIPLDEGSEVGELMREELIESAIASLIFSHRHLMSCQILATLNILY